MGIRNEGIGQCGRSALSEPSCLVLPCKQVLSTLAVFTEKT